MELGIWTVWLVRAAWIATILLMVIGSIPISKLRLFHELMLIFAGRGKILQPSSSQTICPLLLVLLWRQKWTVPQKYFSHFYVVGVVWTTFLFAMTWMYALKMAPLTGGSHVEHWFKVWRAVFLLLLMEIHVLRRLIESFYVFNYSPCARMNILGYFTGLFLSLSINIAPEVVTFAGNQILKDAKMLIQGSLRKSPSQAKEYIIPHGDWFEMVLYVGLLLASGGTDVTIWLLFGFVVGNLTVAAGETHRWYLRKFENYPANRSAIFPYVY
ncbi:polyprenol reductase 2-like [Brassica napus]|uniref:polyprenol reductase 2-like n=1 Tax=Brassica napus TaxID=3708 RepID=UPI00207883B1|nr:polyprenol reductase 2-like [Brassica napus]